MDLISPIQLYQYIASDMYIYAQNPCDRETAWMNAIRWYTLSHSWYSIVYVVSNQMFTTTMNNDIVHTHEELPCKLCDRTWAKKLTHVLFLNCVR